MLSPSDFNNAVPQFTNGSYASNPINPQYVAEPDAENYNRGTEPLQTLPAQWWNWFINKFTARFNKVNIYVKNIFNELAQVLSIFNITPDGTEQTPTTSQLKTVFESCYPQYVKTAASLVGTETTVNGHPLSSNVTVTRSDLGLGTSATVNTGTEVGCIPTVGTALGTTNNNILVTDSTGKLKPSGITVGTAAGCDATLFATKTEINALYGNTVGTALGTAAVGTATTFARSDHVHPVTGLVTTCVDSCNFTGFGDAGNYTSAMRTPLYGLLPYCSDATNGVGYIGTDVWPFYMISAKTFCGTLCGNADAVDNFHASGECVCTLFRAVRESDSGAVGCGYWGGMVSLAIDGASKWWHILSMDWSGSDADALSWVSQFLLPTQQGGIPKYRFNANNGQTAISSSPWKNFITEDNIGAQSVNFATFSNCAAHLNIGGAGYSTWAWSGQLGQPGWLWGSNDGVNMFVWDPANFSVNYANSAACATNDSDGNAINTTYAKKANFSYSNGVLTITM